MAVVAVKSTPITNADATPVTLNKGHIARGRILSDVGVAAVANGDSIGSTYRCVRVRSSDRVSRILLSCTAITTCAGDVGLYDVTAVNSGAVVDVDFFATAVSLAAALAHSDVTFEAAAGPSMLVADSEKQIWQILALTADPLKEYDVAVTLTAAAASAGSIAIETQICGGN